MSKVSDDTCITFREVSENEAPTHHLQITIETPTGDCDCIDCGGVVDTGDGSAGEVKMSFDYVFPYLDLNLILHELGQFLGLIHTHVRPDRDQYITS